VYFVIAAAWFTFI